MRSRQRVAMLRSRWPRVWRCRADPAKSSLDALVDSCVTYEWICSKMTRICNEYATPLHVSHALTCSIAHAAAPIPFPETGMHESIAATKLLKRAAACGVSGLDTTRQRNKQSIQSPQYRRAIEPIPTLGRRRWARAGAAAALSANKCVESSCC